MGDDHRKPVRKLWCFEPGDSSRDDKKGSDPGYILKIESTDFLTDWFWAKRERIDSRTPKVFILRTEKMALSPRLEAWEYSRCGGDQICGEGESRGFNCKRNSFILCR